jgi:hypothetical protein
MPYREEDFANTPFGRFIIGCHITQLNELDPIYIIAQPTSDSVSSASQPIQLYRVSLPSYALTNIMTTPVLLELDPTHSPAR